MFTTRFAFLVGLFALFFASFALAIPLRTESNDGSVPVPRALASHDCSVFIQRWGHNAFDTYYYDFYWQSDSQKRTLYTQESVVPISQGTYLPQWQMGSQPLKVLNVANPANSADAGRVTVSWGSWKGNSWDEKTGCQTNYNKQFERATYLCKFQCDAPAAS